MGGRLLGVLVLGCVAGGWRVAEGQVAPPPPPAPPKTPEYVPPPQPPVLPPSERPTRNPRLERPAPDPVDTMPFESLIQRDADGRVLPLAEPLELAALRKCALVSEDDWANLNIALAERRARVNKSVVDNLDLILGIEGGLIETVDVMKLEQLKSVSESVRALTPQPLLDELQKRQLLNAQQLKLTRRIADEYRQAMMKQMSDDAEREAGGNQMDAATRVTRVMFHDMIVETMGAYRGLRAVAARNFELVAPELGLTPEQEAAIAAPRRVLAGQPSDEQRDAAFAEIFESLTLDQKRAALAAAMEIQAGETPADAK